VQEELRAFGIDRTPETEGSYTTIMGWRFPFGIEVKPFMPKDTMLMVGSRGDVWVVKIEEEEEDV
jgi:hypothetical protein